MTTAALSLDPVRTCLDTGCSRRAMVGELLCPVHLGLVTPREMPDHRAFEAERGKRVTRGLFLSATLAIVGAILGIAVGDLRFGWLGGIAAAAALGSVAARELHFDRFASLLGMLAFFTATALAFSGILVATIASLPLIVEKLLG